VAGGAVTATAVADVVALEVDNEAENSYRPNPLKASNV